MNNHYYDDFHHDGWTVEQWAYCMRQAYLEKIANEERYPEVTYAEALDWHRRHRIVLLSADRKPVLA